MIVTQQNPSHSGVTIANEPRNEKTNTSFEALMLVSIIRWSCPAGSTATETVNSISVLLYLVHSFSFSCHTILLTRDLLNCLLVAIERFEV